MERVRRCQLPKALEAQSAVKRMEYCILKVVCWLGGLIGRVWKEM